jgi:hypothetical protein
MYNLLRSILVHHCLVMRVTLEGFVTVAHLPLQSLAVPLISDAVQHMLAGRLIPAVAKLNRIHLVFFGLFGLYRVDYLVRIDSGQLVSEGLHELISPVFATVSVKGTGMVSGLGRLSIVVIFHIQQHFSIKLMRVETVIGM